MNNQTARLKQILQGGSKLEEGVLLRAYSPLGFYPDNSFHHIDATFIPGPNLIFSIVRFKEISIDDYDLECEWLKPDEIRLLSALMLSVTPFQDGMVFPYPLQIVCYLENNNLSLSDESLWEEAEELLIKEIYKFISNKSSEKLHPTPLPPLITSTEYDFNFNADNEDLQKKLFESIDISDHLLIRGLGALLKGPLLMRHFIFHTEACISAHIAMEASYRIILRRLRKTKANPTSQDASKYLADACNEEYFPKNYFEDFYQDRIKTIHPESRFGVFPQAPLSLDDLPPKKWTHS